MALALNGIGVGKGVGIGRAHVLRRGLADVSHYSIPPHFLQDEIERYRAAVTAVQRQLQSTRRQIPRDVPVDIIALIDVHLLMTEDSAFAREPVLLIERHQCNAEWALQMQREILLQAFGNMSDPYLRARIDDVEQVVNHILRELVRSESAPGSVGEGLRGCVLLVQDLAPADCVLLQQQGVSALITESGGVTSHTAILARSLGLPTILGLKQALRYIRHEDMVVVDGERGVVIVDPDARTLAYYQRRRRQAQRARAELVKLTGRPALTRDGVKITLRANVELPEEATVAKRAGAEGIGLYRTEFLFLDRDETPGEEEQFEAYLRVVRAMEGAPVTIRTVDLGADKPNDGRVFDSRNPALGLRGIRWCLRDPELLRPQLRAILRASAFGPVRLCIPMLTSVSELRQVLMWIERAKQELDARGVGYDGRLAVGAMIEVPAAAVTAEIFATHLDFLSIGTNDLIQYTLAADRLDEEVNYLYDALHPAVLRLIDMTLKAGIQAGVPVAMCGEMAGDSRYTRLLLGLGLRDFSMQSGSVLEVKRVVHQSGVEAASRYARAALCASDAGAVGELVDELNMTH